MKTLPFGCSYSDIWVSPDNWATTTAKASLNKNWFIQCYFFDPAFADKYPKGFPYRKKLNRGKTIAERRAMAKFYFENIPILFEEKGFNPITGAFMIQQAVNLPDTELTVKSEGELHGDLSIVDAIRLARAKLQGSPKHLNEVRVAMQRFNKAAWYLGKTEIKIKYFSFANLNDVIEKMALPDSYYNKCRQYFMAVFKILKKYQCCKENIAVELDKRREVSKPREVMPIETVRLILEHFKTENYSLYRYARIFLYSGTRTTELFSVQAKHVRISDQEYDVLVKKGNQYTWETKVILQDVIDLWRELLAECKSVDDFLFSHNREPGPEPGNPKQITKRWRQHVKLKLAIYRGEVWTISALAANRITGFSRITADFYSMKHAFLDLLDQQQTENTFVASDVMSLVSGLNVDENTKAALLSALSQSPQFDMAQKMAAHRSVGITNKVYKVNKGKRENEFLKKISISI